MNSGPVEQIWFQNEYVSLFEYAFFFLLPSVLLLLGNIFKPNLPFYALTRKQYKLSEKTYTFIYAGLLLIVIGGYIIGTFRFFGGIGILPNDRVKFYYFHPAINKIVNSEQILSYRIVPDGNKDNSSCYLEIYLNKGISISSSDFTEENKDKLKSAIQMLEKLKIKEQ